jgi:hypothetical protein
MLPYQFDASFSKILRAFDGAPPFSAAQDIHPSAPLKALFLDYVDPRSILYTLYYDEKEGIVIMTKLIVVPHQRPSYDFTCNNVEAAVIGNSISRSN